MSIPKKLEAHLTQHHVAYSHVYHAPVHGAQLAAAVMHFPGKEVAKTVVVRCGHEALLAVLPASHHINFERLGVLTGGKVHLLEERRCAELFPDCEAGAIPPFGELYAMRVFLDHTLTESPEIVFCAGTLSEGVRMEYSEFKRLVKPTVGSFAERD